MIRKERSGVKCQIINAFLELMAEKSYMEITATEIINTAQIARASFYRSFSSVNDVIDTIADELFKEFFEDIFPALNGTDENRCRDFLYKYFSRFVTDQKKITEIRFQNASIIFSRIDGRMQMRDAELPDITMREKYMAIGKIGLINNMVKKWMDSGMIETPEEMINYIMSFITLF